MFFPADAEVMLAFGVAPFRRRLAPWPLHGADRVVPYPNSLLLDASCDQGAVPAKAMKQGERMEGTEAGLCVPGAQPGTHHQDTAKFLRQATTQTFSGEHASLADRIGRRKYYNDRSRDESQGAFQR